MKSIILLLTAFIMNVDSSETKAISNVQIFLKNPNNYTFKCGCGLGEVLTGSLATHGDMTISYYYPCNGRKLYGKLIGTYDQNENQFEGTYNTEDKMYYGPIQFSFNESGEGTGAWDNGVGNILMNLKQ